MNKILQDNRVKGKSTDKKIAQIVLDLYTKNVFYDKIYQMVESFFKSADNISLNTWSKSLKNIDIESETPFKNIDLMTAFLGSIKLDFWEILLSAVFLNQETKSKDIEEKYEISNVTVKARLKQYFDFTKIKEWNLTFLWLKPKLDVLAWIAFYFYFKNKDIEQNNLILNLVNLFEKNI
jgi:lysyl-tRNA synthetase class II